MTNNETPTDEARGEESGRLSRWGQRELDEFLRLRQELFLDPLGSNRKRFDEAAVLLQRALFSRVT